MSGKTEGEKKEGEKKAAQNHCEISVRVYVSFHARAPFTTAFIHDRVSFSFDIIPLNGKDLSSEIFK